MVIALADPQDDAILACDRDLEPVVLTDLSGKEKNIFFITTTKSQDELDTFLIDLLARDRGLNAHLTFL